MPLLAHATLVVLDYDDAIDFWVNKVGLELLEDTDLGAGKRWVRVGRDGGFAILLARATTPDQVAAVGNQTGGRVMLFFETGDFGRDYDAMRARGVEFVRPPRAESYGTVAVFKDLYGNLADLIEPARA